MKVLLGKEFVIGTILCVLIAQINAKPQIPVKVVPPSQASSSSPPSSSPPSSTSSPSPSNNDSSSFHLADLADLLNEIPIIGPILKAILNYIAETIISVDQLTNGFLARLVGGSLPCVITLEKGIVCSGTSVDGGSYGIFASLINDIPEGFLPESLKGIILAVVRITINPIMDTLFGGLPTKRIS